MKLMWKLGRCQYSDGRYAEAEAPFTEALKRAKRMLGEQSVKTLTSMANLASIYRNRGRRNEAEELEVDVMETRKRVLWAEREREREFYYGYAPLGMSLFTLLTVYQVMLSLRLNQNYHLISLLHRPG